MITQLATVAIRARVRVSLATVPPKLVIRSKSRSRLLASDSLSLPSWAWAMSGSRSVRSTSFVASAAGFLGDGSAALRISNRALGLAIPAASRTLANSAADDLGGSLGAVERRGVEAQRILPAAGESGRRARARSWKLPPRVPPGIGFRLADAHLHSGQCRPERLEDLVLDLLGVLVGGADVEPRQAGLVPGRPEGSRQSRRARRSPSGGRIPPASIRRATGPSGRPR